MGIEMWIALIGILLIFTFVMCSSPNNKRKYKRNTTGSYRLDFLVDVQYYYYIIMITLGIIMFVIILLLRQFEIDRGLY